MADIFDFKDTLIKTKILKCVLKDLGVTGPVAQEGTPEFRRLLSKMTVLPQVDQDELERHYQEIIARQQNVKPTIILGHTFVPLSKTSRDAFPEADADSLICHLPSDRGLVLLWSPKTNTLSEFTWDGLQRNWTYAIIMKIGI